MPDEMLESMLASQRAMLEAQGAQQDTLAAFDDFTKKLRRDMEEKAKHGNTGSSSRPTAA